MNYCRFVNTWLWKGFVAALLLCIFPMMVILLLGFSYNLSAGNEQSYGNSEIAVKAAAAEEERVVKSVPYHELPENVIMRRFPYAGDPTCRNFSLSLYEDETFELVGLVSFPGSGNTWTRHLIQLATGVYTGSFYFDMNLFSQGFLGERELWYSGRTIVQKFHEKFDKRMGLEKAILLIREPFPAILSYANYMEAGHTGNARRLPYHHKDWPNFLARSAYEWISFAKSWIESPAKLQIIYYEHLRLQPVENLQAICDFLNQTCNNLKNPCFQKKIEGAFRRSTSSIPLRIQKDATRQAKYPPEIKTAINDGINHVNSLLVRYGHEPLPILLYKYYNNASET